MCIVFGICPVKAGRVSITRKIKTKEILGGFKNEKIEMSFDIHTGCMFIVCVCRGFFL
jgi:hypothetical protein